MRRPWPTKNGCCATAKICTFMIVRLCILLGMRNVSDKSFRENQNILCSITFSENRANYDNAVKYGRATHRSQMTI
jgi:hypothetical protein